MRHRTWGSTVALCTLLVSFAAGTAWAQRPNKQSGAGSKPIKVEGAIKSIANNVITVSSGRDNTVQVMVAPTTNLAITGTAELGALAVGMNVDFTAELNKAGEIQDEIKELTLREATDASVKPGLYEPEDTSGKPLRAIKDGNHTYLVRAKVRTNKDGAITVAATGAPAIKLKLASDCAINCSFKNTRLASPGDGVFVEGKQVQPGQVIGDSVTIKMTMPYAPKGKGAAAKTPNEPSPFGSP
ncbi:MAG: hypothetical protein JSS27_20365 [Planctomycetes bacterium]|nr:hypothetical protein [Planctomycetota bacterium]